MVRLAKRFMKLARLMRHMARPGNSFERFLEYGGISTGRIAADTTGGSAARIMDGAGAVERAALTAAEEVMPRSRDDAVAAVLALPIAPIEVAHGDDAVKSRADTAAMIAGET